MNRELLNKYVADGLVREQKHPALPLSIFNYAERVQYQKLWDDVTRQCRGLVMHGDKVVARPFAKFFNDTEHSPDEIPWHLPCEITEKMDGSLLILFCFNGEWLTATRGSFISDQSRVGREIIDEHYGHVVLDARATYLFEVLYPENRIVLDYGEIRDVALLSVIDTETGDEWPRHDWPASFCHVKALPPTANVKELRSLIRDDEEGYVVRFSNGFRMKVKGARYLELHKVYSGISSRLVWENLAGGKPFDELLAIIPDEFADWVRAEKSALLAQFDAIHSRVEEAYIEAKRLSTRKDQALMICEQYQDIRGAVFAALDNKPVEGLLWKQLYPEFRRPAKVSDMLAT